MDNTLGQYKIVREIGKGGMGVIYKALNPANQKSVAIKVLPPMMVDRVTVERFHREVQAMVKLKHPNMIEVYESSMEHGKHFIVMEFIDGENLKNMIKAKGPLPIATCLKIAVQVADALAHMHQSGMIHRDIKPANIMIMPDGRVKLMDYGLVKILGMTSVTIEGASLGTVEYMSPEQITGEGVDARTDIYSLGITIYEMVTGRLPFKGETIQEVLRKHQSETPPSARQIRPSVPMELELTINKTIAKNAKDRYSTAEILKNDLQKILGTVSGELSTSTVEIKPSQHKPARPTSTEKVVLIPEKKHVVGLAKESSSVPWGKIFIFIILLATSYVYRDKIKIAFNKVPWKKVAVFPGQKDLVSETNASLMNLEEAEKRFAQGKIYSQQGLLDKAVEEFEAAIQLRMGQPAYYKELATTYERQAEFKKAIKVWEELLKFDDNAVEVRMAQQQIHQLSQQSR